MNMKNYKVVLGVVSVALLFVALYYSYPKKMEAPETPIVENNENNDFLVYKNREYGFSLVLPLGWKDYSFIEDEWEGDSIDANGNVSLSAIKGPLVSLRHPDWEYKSPRQDIPIMVFTLKQWSDLEADNFHIGAAPIGPTEIGRNKKYVFAIPARYNYAFLTGFEEVDQILRGDNFKTF